jgi:hypothetical protein
MLLVVAGAGPAAACIGIGKVEGVTHGPDSGASLVRAVSGAPRTA